MDVKLSNHLASSHCSAPYVMPLHAMLYLSIHVLNVVFEKECFDDQCSSFGLPF